MLGVCSKTKHIFTEIGDYIISTFIPDFKFTLGRKTTSKIYHILYYYLLASILLQ